MSDFGVHKAHCCVRHGCKYNEDDCPVTLGLVAASFPCEQCGELPQVRKVSPEVVVLALRRDQMARGGQATAADLLSDRLMESNLKHTISIIEALGFCIAKEDS